jgi:hypothetical protein
VAEKAEAPTPRVLRKAFILKGDKVVCFVSVLKLLILKGMGKLTITGKLSPDTLRER